MKSKFLKFLLVLSAGSFFVAQTPVYATRRSAPQITSVTELEEDVDKEEIDLNDLEVNSSAEMTIENDEVILDVINENGALVIPNLELDTETRYALHYSYQKLDGDLNTFGGHTDGLYINNIVSVDGDVTSQYEENDSAYAADDKEEHQVVVEFVTPRDKANANFYIQPNRGDFDFVTLRIFDVYLVEIPE
ncbi:hypothetical protein [Fundicoccus culcitae]|uniref:Uncharacterized protein n=1 Tax=Fundicoccus culcitae TaxID=2969821 RepID=A0ABY5P9Y8_9LACT|nr:hypothetical protein [Fundicoccus culcitae]UUX35253.1 hypothetical protein NRE15_06310 [Fundicoccus culcitae]